MTFNICKSFLLYSWSKYRLFLIAMTVPFLLLIILKLSGPSPADTLLHFLGLILPVFSQLFFFIAAVCVFSYTETSTDLINRESAFPSQLYNLPVTTFNLVIWPLLFGIMLIVIPGSFTFQFLLTESNLARGPSDFTSTLWWLLYMSISVFAWAQAIVWSPFPYGWLRIIALTLILTLHFPVFISIASHEMQSTTAFTLILISILTACICSVLGVGRSRRGELKDIIEKDTTPEIVNRQDLHSFTDTTKALSWYEWRLHGKSPLILLFMFIFMSGFTGSVLDIYNKDLNITGDLLEYIIGPIVILPMFLVVVTGPVWANFQSNKYESYDIPAFFSARPSPTRIFFLAKFLAVAKSILLAFCLMAVIIICLSFFIDILDNFLGLIQFLNLAYGTFEIIILFTVIPVLFIFFIISSIANIIWMPWFFRKYMHWIVAGYCILLLFVPGIFNTGWYNDTSTRDLYLSYIHIALAGLAIFKTLLLFYLITRVRSTNLYTMNDILVIGSIWVSCILILFTMSLHYLPEDMFNWYPLLSGLVLFTPVLGIMGAPLALHYNRHR